MFHFVVFLLHTKTTYTYDDMYRMASEVATAGTQTLSASYTYSNDLLTSITTGSTTYNFSYGDFALRTNISIGNRPLADYFYTDDQNNYLEKLEYKNNDSVQYTYDDLGRVTKQTYEDGATVEYKYDNNGALATVTDRTTNIATNTTNVTTTTYYYDFTDRLMKYVESSTDYSHSVGYEYDQLNNLTALVDTINGVKHTTSYTYDDDNRVTAVTASGTTVSYTYDSFGRVTEQITTRGSTTVLTEQFTYKDTATDKTTSQIATYKTIAGGVTKTYTYTYDDNGNILTVSEGGKTTSYVYDSQNQLIRENNEAGGFTHEWTYDNAGNILTRKEYAYTAGTLGAVLDTVNYGYGDSDWGDLLKSYDGQAIDSDQIGNMLFDGTWTYTWKHGRQLASMSKGSTTWTYTYNADGLRTKRTTGNSTYIYGYTGDKLTYMKREGTSMYFSYDANGRPTMMLIGNTPYFYVTNLQGDVVALTDSTGAIVAEYTYDAWGNVVTDTSNTVAGIYNPLRYRGYVYDAETGLYYVSSRYYDPEIGRWINADGIVDTKQGVLGTNMYAYCGNNPINRFDPSGLFWKEIGDFFVNVGKAIVTTIVLVAAVPSASCALIIGKETHYTRNDYNTVKIETIDQVPSDWTTSNTDKYPNREKGAAANAHQNTAPSKDKPNTKFSSPDKHEEVIFSFDEVLIVDPVDIGTYNYGTNIVTHWYYDVVPWIWWGNSEDDPSTVWDRANVFVWGAS